MLGVILQRRIPRGGQGQAHVCRLGQDGGQTGRVVVGNAHDSAGGRVHDGGQLHAARGGWVTVAAHGSGRGHAAGGCVFMDRGRDAGVHDGGVARGGAAGRHGGRALTAVATMGKLVVVQAACELGFLQVGGNMFVWHFLQASLEQVNFLFYVGVSTCGPSVSRNLLSCHHIPHPRSKPCLRQSTSSCGGAS